VVGFDLDAARLIRLQQDLDSLLPDEEEGPRRELLEWLLVGARQGVDLIPSFRDALRWQRDNPPAATATEVGTPPARGDSGLEMEALPTPRRATLWPCRPKRLPDELLSSWLWRTARESGAPPRRFVFDAVGGARLADVDREIDDAAIARLAFLSGQSETHLRRGTMRPDVPIAAFDLVRDPRERAPQALLQHGDLVLNRARRRGSTPIIQYCPICLGRGRAAYWRRGWRCSLEVVCFIDGCFLMDVSAYI